MTDFKVHILGVGSATPSLRHQPSCQVIDFRGRLFMVDCGEGAQVGMRKMKLKYSRLEHIFISHLHGDHFFGLPGLLSTLSLHDIGGRITVHIPPEGAEWLQMTMDRFCPNRSFELVIEPIPHNGACIYNDDKMEVTAFPLYHRIPCTGFLFKRKAGLPHLKKDMVDWLDIPVKLRHKIKEGDDYITPDGRIFLNNRLTVPGTPAASYAYCSDTAFNMSVIQYIEGVDVLYHEATYLETEKQKARERFHSTAAEAVRIAVAAGVKTLIIGHYSKSYASLEGHLKEALDELNRLGGSLTVIAADEGMTFDI